jgi:plasmid stabilization system protein ParE
MTIKLSKVYQLDLIDQVRYIYKDKPRAALKFRKDLINNIKKDLKHPFHFKESIYSDGDENIRDYVFKGYKSVYKIDLKQNSILVFGFIKYKNSF